MDLFWQHIQGVLAEKVHNRSYRPYFMDRLVSRFSQYFGMQQITSELENKQGICNLHSGLQKRIMTRLFFQTYFNNDQLEPFGKSIRDLASQHAANRLLK